MEAYRAKKAIAEVYGEPFAEGKPVEGIRNGESQPEDYVPVMW